MQISTPAAKAIIREMSKVIPCRINIMNKEGNIIASSDPKRIGEYHMGALRLIKEHREELCIVKEDEYDGGRPGINLPIMVRGKIAGVIGITGHYDEICPYAQILRRMSEIMLVNELLSQEAMQLEHRRHQFLQEWLFQNQDQIDPTLYTRGMQTGIDIQRSRRFLVLCKVDGNGTELYAQLKPLLSQQLYGDEDAFVLPVKDCLFIGMRMMQDDMVHEWLEDLFQKSEITLNAGIDMTGESSVQEKISQCRKALYCGKVEHQSITFYQNVTMEIFMDEIDVNRQNEFIAKVFHTDDCQELDDMIQILGCYYRHNGSLHRAGEELFLHKNTLQNRLHRIRDITGYDPRSLENIALFQMAIRFYQYRLVNA